MPNYSEILNSCGDNKLSCYSKGRNTQHQFTFEAVVPNEYFPYGVKVTYRAYSRSEVYEIVKEANNNPEGINLSPQLCYVDSFPKAKAATANSPAVPEGKV